MRFEMVTGGAMLLVLVASLGCDESASPTSGAGGVAWTTASVGGDGGGVLVGGNATVSVGGNPSTGGNGSGPSVVTITPSDGTTAVTASTPITVTFSEAMDAATATVSTTAQCSGSLQLSRDGFSSCVALANPPSSSDDTTFMLDPSADLMSAGLYQLRATTALASAGGTPLAAPFESTGFRTRYAHTVTIDGSNDFGADDELASSTVGARLFVSFDETYLYLGLEHVDVVVGGSGNRFVYFLLSTDATLANGNSTSSDGKATFGPTKKMMFHLKSQIDGGSYTELRVANGSDWDTDWGTTGKAWSKANGYFEASIAWSELGTSPTDVIITTFTIDYNGDNGNGYLYNMLPAATAASGATPVDLVQSVHLRLPTSLAPNDGSVLELF